MDIGVATNGHYVFSLGTLTRSLTACLVARPARSLHSYLHTEEEEGDYRATELSNGRRRLREHLPIDRGRVKSTQQRSCWKSQNL